MGGGLRVSALKVPEAMLDEIEELVMRRANACRPEAIGAAVRGPLQRGLGRRSDQDGEDSED